RPSRYRDGAAAERPEYVRTPRCTCFERSSARGFAFRVGLVSRSTPLAFAIAFRAWRLGVGKYPRILFPLSCRPRGPLFDCSEIPGVALGDKALFQVRRVQEDDPEREREGNTAESRV